MVKLERPLLLLVLVTVVGTGAAVASMLAGAPGSAATGGEVVRWLAQHADAVRWAVWCGTVGSVAFAVLIALLRATLPAAYGDIFLIGGVVALVTGLIQNWVWAALALRGEANAPEVARGLLDVASFWGPLLTGAWVTMISPVTVLALRRHSGLPRWLGVVGTVVALEQAAETITVFGSTGFTAPGGAMNMVLGASLTLLWIASFGLYRALAAQPMTEFGP